MGRERTRRSFFMTAAGCAALIPLAACSGMPGPDQANGSTGIGDVLGKVAAGIQKACHVVADLGALQALISTFPAGTAAVAIVNAFCAAMPKSAGRMATPVQVNGRSTVGGHVVVRGVTVPYTRR